MFKPIARVNTDTDYAVEIGYEVPEVITDETKIDVSTRIVVKEDAKASDPESPAYQQAKSIAEVLKIGFDIGCSYTTKVIEQVNRMGNDLMNDPNVNVTGSTSDLVME